MSGSEAAILKLKNELLEVQGCIELREKELRDLGEAEDVDGLATSIHANMAKDYAQDAFMNAFCGENPYSKAPKASSGCLLM